MVVVKELHDVKEQVEGLALLSAGAVARGLVAVGYGDGQRLQPLSLGLGTAWAGGHSAQQSVQQLQHLGVVLESMVQ